VNAKSDQGFTLVELLVVIVLIGILGLLVSATWLGFVQRQRLNQGSDRLFRTLKIAHETARYSHIPQQISIRQTPTHVEFLTHPAAADHFVPPDLWQNPTLWSRLDSSILVDQTNGRGDNETTFDKKAIDGMTTWRLIFNTHGCPVSQPEDTCTEAPHVKGRLGLKSVHADTANDAQILRRCVILSTMLGTMRQGTNQPKPDDGKYCY
jgi:prepilin-type N-terminal cleavage/methylation domain-containing protein